MSTLNQKIIIKSINKIGPIIPLGHIVPYTIELVNFLPSIAYLTTLILCAAYFLVNSFISIYFHGCVSDC